MDIEKIRPRAPIEATLGPRGAQGAPRHPEPQQANKRETTGAETHFGAPLTRRIQRGAEVAEAVLIIVWSPRWLFRVHVGPAVLITVWGSRCLGSLSNYQTRRPVLFPVWGPRLQSYRRTARRVAPMFLLHQS